MHRLREATHVPPHRHVGWFSYPLTTLCTNLYERDGIDRDSDISQRVKD